MSNLLYARVLKMAIRFYAGDFREIPVSEAESFGLAFFKSLEVLMAQVSLGSRDYSGLFNTPNR